MGYAMNDERARKIVDYIQDDAFAKSLGAEVMNDRALGLHVGQVSLTHMIGVHGRAPRRSTGSFTRRPAEPRGRYS